MSEENQPNTMPPLYSLTAIGVATFIGSMLAGGYMLASNYIALGKRRLGMYTIYGSCGLFIVFGLISTYMPQTPTAIIVSTIIQVLIAIGAANVLQGAMFSYYERTGGSYHSMLRAVGVGLLVAMAVFMLLVIFAAFTLDIPAAQ